MDGDQKTFQLRYVGPRFNGARLPVDMLSDLAAFRDLLFAYVKETWRAKNADRERLPRGFDNSISLDLIALEDGSAIPVLNWNRKKAQATLPGFTSELETLISDSYRQMIKLIDEAGRDVFPRALSSDQIRALNKFGSGLRDNEKIEFLNSTGSDNNIVYLDLTRRKKLITNARGTYQTRFEGIGKLLGSSVDNDEIRGRIIVQTEEYDNIEIRLEAERIKNDFDGYIGSDVQFVLQIEVDNREICKSVIDVYNVEITAQISPELIICRDRLDKLKSLNEGWHNGAGAAITAASMSTASNFLAKTATLSGKYRIFPTEEGGILFEFERRGWDLSVEFRASGTIEMYGIEIDGSDEIEPKSFSALDEIFYKFFNTHVGRESL